MFSLLVGIKLVKTLILFTNLNICRFCMTDNPEKTKCYHASSLEVDRFLSACFPYFCKFLLCILKPNMGIDVQRYAYL